MTTSTFPKSQVYKSIHQQTINHQTIYYSFTNKYQATLSMLKNQRLLIFNSRTGLLYYINEPKSLPFIMEIPKPKNDSADMNVSMVRSPVGSQQFSVQFGTRNQKGQATSIEWNFLMENKNLANAWVNLIKQFKERKMQEVLQEKRKMQKSAQKAKNDQKDPVKNSRVITSNAFIHDTIGYGIMQAPKYNSRTPLSEPVEQPKYTQSPIKMTQSRNNNSISPIKQPNNKTIDNQLILIPGVIHSRPTDLSPQHKSFISQNKNNQSRLTFKDQIQEIVSRNRNYQPSSPAKSYRPQNDWNLRFLQTQSQQVIMDFQEYAVKQFFTVLGEDRRSRDKIRVYLQPECMVIVTDARTVQAKKVKSQFRNYHFITESCKDLFIVGVPLACLIELEGVVALVKSLIPDHAPRIQLTQQLMLQLKDLQRYTRVKNSVLKKATLYDLSQIYGSTGKRLIYINQLIEYLPLHIQQSFIGGSLRPQHMLDNVDQFMCGGMAIDRNRHDLKILNDMLDHIKRNVTQLAKQLSCNDLTFASGTQLKDIMHSRGINLKHLPQLYQQTQNKQVKKYIHTFMVAKIAKDNILQNLSQTRSLGNGHGVRQVIQKSIRLLIQGNSNMSNQLWKEIAINFRKQYSIPMSNSDVLGTFFLNCLMKIIPGMYDLGRVNLNKVIFKEDNIIGKGFLAELVPKVKSYYRYTTEQTQRVMLICKGERLYENYLNLVESLQLKSKKIPRYLTLSKTSDALKQYLTFYTCPQQFQPTSFPHLHLFQPILSQPPTFTSLMITYNYLIWCLQKQQFQQFKQVLQSTLKIIDLWLDPAHVMHCEFYQALAQYYEQIGSIEDGINFMKESLGVCIRSGGVTGRKAGEKYLALGQKLLKAGNIPQSIQNFLKAKANLQSYKVTTIKYPLLLTKLATVSLSQSDFPSCFQYAKLSIQKFQQLQSRRPTTLLPKGFYDEFSIKPLQVMSRAFQIEDKKMDIYRMAQLAAAKYNKTPNPKVFATMVKLCLTAVIIKNNLQKAKVLQSMVQKVILPPSSQPLSPQTSLTQLMTLTPQFNVMQRFMFKFQSLERVAAQINSRKALSNDNKEFVNVLRLVMGLVGEEYVLGLVEGKEVEE